MKIKLEESGHIALMFEDNFFPWHPNFIKTCLQKVDESDIFILFLNENVGTYLDSEKSSPTYPEFRRAINQEKYIIAFLDANLKAIYEEHIKADLDQRYKEYCKNHYGRKPDYTIDIVQTVIDQDLGRRQKEKIEKINPFIWAQY